MQRDSQAGSDPLQEQDAYAVVGSYATARRAHEAGLAVLASGHHYWVRSADGRYLLIVPRIHADRLRKEIEIAENRNRHWPPRSLELPTKSTSKVPTAGAVLVLLLAFYAQTSLWPLKDLGANSSHGVLQDGEWWRLITAVTLHADVGHLAGNLLGLSIFAYLSCRYMGSGLAWILILAAAACSNLTNDILQAERDYISLGASTAVFAALGILTGFPVGCYLRTREPIMARDWLIPFFGGCVLFAWMGGGDFPTDLAGHLWSFVYGLILAVIFAWTAWHAKLESRHQQLLVGAAYLIVLGSWGWACAQS